MIQSQILKVEIDFVSEVGNEINGVINNLINSFFNLCRRLNLFVDFSEKLFRERLETFFVGLLALTIFLGANHRAIFAIFVLTQESGNVTFGTVEIFMIECDVVYWITQDGFSFCILLMLTFHKSDCNDVKRFIIDDFIILKKS
jgi:hypothetical protein